MAFVAPVSCMSYAASIQVQTNKTIEGRSPELFLYNNASPVNSVNEFLSFFLIKGGVETKITPIHQGDIIIDKSTKLENQFKTLLGTKIATQKLHNLDESVLQVIDVDNPINRENEIKGKITVQLLDKDNTPLLETDLATVPDIRRMPYKLKIILDDAQVITPYGSPNDSKIFAGTHEYSLNSQPDFCYEQPSLFPHITMVNDNGEIVRPVSIWDPQKGFSVQSQTDATKNFPGKQGLKVRVLFVNLWRY